MRLFNETWLAFTGRTFEQEAGDGWAEGVHPDDFERCVAHYLAHFHRHEAFEMEYRLRRHDGGSRWIFDRGVPFSDDSGAFAGFIGSCVNVDERRKVQEAQQQHNQEQLALARDFEKWILAIVSHDIRDPLGTILFAARRLQELEPTRAKKHAEIVERGVHRIQHIVGDLLDLAREREGSGIPIDRSRPIYAPSAARSSTNSKPSRATARSRSTAMPMAPAHGTNTASCRRSRI